MMKIVHQQKKVTDPCFLPWTRNDAVGESLNFDIADTLVTLTPEFPLTSPLLVTVHHRTTITVEG